MIPGSSRMHETLENYLGWCPHRRMTPIMNAIQRQKMNSRPGKLL